MGLTLKVWIAFIHKVGKIGGRDSLLTCLQYVTCTCLCTIAEKELGLVRPALNLHARSFCSQNIEIQNDQTKDNIPNQ